jgi:hypothetical protein
MFNIYCVCNWFFVCFCYCVSIFGSVFACVLLVVFVICGSFLVFFGRLDRV